MSKDSIDDMGYGKQRYADIEETRAHLRRIKEETMSQKPRFSNEGDTDSQPSKPVSCNEEVHVSDFDDHVDGYKNNLSSYLKQENTRSFLPAIVLFIFLGVICFVTLTRLYGDAVYQDDSPPTVTTAPKIERSSVVKDVPVAEVKIESKPEVVIPAPVFAQEKTVAIATQERSSSLVLKTIQSYPRIDMNEGYDCDSSVSVDNGYPSGSLYQIPKGEWFTVRGCMLIMASEVTGINGEKFVFEVVNPEDPFNTSYQCPTVGVLGCVFFMNEIAKNPAYTDKKVAVYTKVGGWVSFMFKE